MAKILIIDDDPGMRSMLRQALKKEGYEVLEAANGQKGLEELEKSDPDIIITDVVMPEKDGLELVAELRAKRVNAKIIVISGAEELGVQSYLPVATEMGAAQVFSKPFDMGHLLETVKEFLE